MNDVNDRHRVVVDAITESFRDILGAACRGLCREHAKRVQLFAIQVTVGYALGFGAADAGAKKPSREICARVMNDIEKLINHAIEEAKSGEGGKPCAH